MRRYFWSHEQGQANHNLGFGGGARKKILTIMFIEHLVYAKYC